MECRARPSCGSGTGRRAVAEEFRSFLGLCVFVGLVLAVIVKRLVF